MRLTKRPNNFLGTAETWSSWMLSIAAIAASGCGADPKPLSPNYSAGTYTVEQKEKGLGGGSGSAKDGSGSATDKSADANPDTGKVAGGSDPKTKPKDDEHLDLPGVGSAAGSASGPQQGANLTEDCGFDAEHASMDLLNENLAGQGRVAKGTKKVLGPITTNYTTTTTATLAWRSTPEAQVLNLVHNVTGSPSASVADADKVVTANDGAATTDFLPLATRAATLAKTIGWNGIVCTVHPATKITLTQGGSEAVVQFDPPLPAAVSSAASLARLQSELVADHQWTGLTATVVSSTIAALPAGQKFSGVATLRKIIPSLAVPLDATGKTAQVSGTVAYELTIDFGGPASTLALGLNPSTKYFIDTSLHRYSGLVIDTLTPEPGAVGTAQAFLPAP